ncbi:uncharacterized protein TP_0369-like [Panicum virgatum]|uniref:uncharacterized protein TP_0369-like n=1 Tax=Panicum virgatum TaxID=38727 RepID=UPI0019D64D2F|nr:uncharacterized protein TP_0369-like [Panicum virgatum]
MRLRPWIRLRPCGCASSSRSPSATAGVRRRRPALTPSRLLPPAGGRASIFPRSADLARAWSRRRVLVPEPGRAGRPLAVPPAARAAADPRGHGPAAPRESLAAPVACSRSPRLLAPPTTRAAADPRRRGKVAHPDSAPRLLAPPPSRSRPPARVAGRKGP